MMPPSLSAIPKDLNLVPDHVLCLLLFTLCRICSWEKKELVLAEGENDLEDPDDDDDLPHPQLLRLFLLLLYRISVMLQLQAPDRKG